MYIRGLIPRNIAEVAEAVTIDFTSKTPLDLSRVKYRLIQAVLNFDREIRRESRNRREYQGEVTLNCEKKARKVIQGIFRCNNICVLNPVKRWVHSFS